MSIGKDLEELAMQEEFLGVYDNEKEQRILQNTCYLDGKDDGFVEGERSKQVEIAKNMLNFNFNVETIVSVTGLTLEDVQSLKN